MAKTKGQPAKLESGRLRKVSSKGTKTREMTNRAFLASQVAVLYGQGSHQMAIVEEMGKRGHKLNQSQVAKMIAETVEEWKRQAVDDVMERRLRELVGIDQAETIAWREFEFSQIRRVVVKGNPKAPNPEDRIDKVITERGLGDPRWHDQAMKCKEMRMRLLKLVGPANVTLHTGDNINNQNTFNVWKEVETLTQDPLKVKLKELEAAHRVTVTPEEVE